MLHFVEYDLRKERNYQLLWDELKRLGARRILKSLWCFESEATVADLRNHFRRFIDGDDGLIVMAVGTGWAGWNLDAKPHNTATV